MRKFTFLTCSLLYLGIGMGNAQLTDIVNFNDLSNPKGWLPSGNVVLSGNVLYGMTGSGGLGFGNIFSVDANGNNFKDLWDFDGGGDNNGSEPFGSLILSGGVLYGMTYQGGINSFGNIFSVNIDGSGYKDLWDFNSGNDTNGTTALADLTIVGGVLYGMTTYGGINGSGNIFRINIDGSGYKDVWNFHGGIDTNGSSPSGDFTVSGTVFYGMTTDGGKNHDGNIFRINTDGSGYRDLWDFDGGGDTNGYLPHGSLTLSGNVLYGMTYEGGINSKGNVFRINTDGSGYKDLWNFDGGGDTNGSLSSGSLILSGNMLFGMTTDGGIDSDGNIFSIDTNGNGYKNLFNFNGINGWAPHGSLIISGNILYGMTELGGANDDGVVFSFRDTNGALGMNNLPPLISSINIFPNPSTGLFTMQLKNENLKAKNIEVYNVLGEQVYSRAIVSSSSFIVDLSSQPNGIYLYRVTGDSGELLGEGKLVVQK